MSYREPLQFKPGELVKAIYRPLTGSGGASTGRQIELFAVYIEDLNEHKDSLSFVFLLGEAMKSIVTKSVLVHAVDV